MQITRNALKRFNIYMDQVSKSPNSELGMKRSKFDSIAKKMKKMEIEANFVYSVTLENPLISIDVSDIEWIIKNALPSSDELREVYKLF